MSINLFYKGIHHTNCLCIGGIIIDLYSLSLSEILLFVSKSCKISTIPEEHHTTKSSSSPGNGSASDDSKPSGVILWNPNP